MTVVEREDDLVQMSYDYFQRKMEDLMDEKAKLRRFKMNREKGVEGWEKQAHDLISWIAKHLKEKTASIYDKHFDCMTSYTSSLTAINRDLMSLVNEKASKHQIDEKIEEMQQIQWDSDFNGEFDFILLENDNNNQNGVELAKAYVDAEYSADLSFLNKIEWISGLSSNLNSIIVTPEKSNIDESSITAAVEDSNRLMMPPALSKEKIFNEKDSFYTKTDNAVMGVHYFVDGDTDILKSRKDKIDEFNKSDFSMINKPNKGSNMRASCPTCKQSISVVTQLKLAEEKNRLNNNNDSISIFQNLLKSPKEMNLEKSPKKNISFFRKTTIVEEELSKEGVTTPKISEGNIRLSEKSNASMEERRHSSIRSKLNLSSPPLKKDASSNAQPLSTTTSETVKTNGEEIFESMRVLNQDDFKKSNGDSGKPAGTFVGTDPKHMATVKFKYDGFCPTSICKEDKNLFVCSPTVHRVAVVDSLSNCEIGYLKVPNVGYDNPRNVICLSPKVMVLDNRGIHVFHVTGTFEKSIFCDKSKFYRGLARYVHNDYVFVLTLEIIDEDLNLTLLDLNNETVHKKISITEAKGSNVKCRFLACHDETVIITDMNDGRIFKVDMKSNKSSEISIPSHTKIKKATGVTFDENNRFAVSDMESKLLHVFKIDGSHEKTLNLYTRDDSEISPTGILLDGNHLFVADAGNSVYKFALM